MPGSPLCIRGHFTMTNPFASRYAPRVALVVRLLVLLLLAWSVLRLALYGVFGLHSIGPGQLAVILGTGALFDALTALTVLSPLILALSLFRMRWMNLTWVRRTLYAMGAFALCFDLFVQYFFFEEYSARYNHLALDYVMYPDEVLGNIFASYNVPLFLGLAGTLAAALTWWNARHPAPLLGDWRVRDRLVGTMVTGAAALTLWMAWTLAPFSVASDRLAGELALNGWAELVRAYMTSHLDYDAYYSSVPARDVPARLSRLLERPVSSQGLTHHFVPRSRAPGDPLDIVIIMEESLGSNFSARFGGATDDPVTPELDRWSHEGLALTNLVATGNRTVRGMEGILCSFPPLPGDSIVKRDRSQNVASIATVLSAQGFMTTFFTGGRGLFDNVRRFMTANGFREFVELPDYPATAFRTVWGVADEFVLDAMIERHSAARRRGQRWFGAAITGSNHKPFAYPSGRVTWPSGKSARRGAVLYADWAIGRYLTRAKQAGLLDHTVVLIVGDHGARVYGAERIPVASYRIPALFLSPDPRYRGVAIDRLASQVDLAPTLLSLAGIEYDAPFFGQDLLGLPDSGGRAFVNHNRGIGLLTDDRLVVLGVHRSETFYQRADRKSDTFTQVDGRASRDGELAADAAAVFQAAYEAYMTKRFRLPGQ